MYSYSDRLLSWQELDATDALLTFTMSAFGRIRSFGEIVLALKTTEQPTKASSYLKDAIDDRREDCMLQFAIVVVN